ncbi:MAG: NADH-quinone oxidoreductase subunit L [Verrucomicrobiales bacterium]|nr:NADH-quinone oxidoreductase subunit L [Verrucomicrobiales bacterium]
MEPNVIAWTILLLPLVVAAFILFFLKKTGGIAAFLATGSALVTLVLALLLAHPELLSGGGGEAHAAGADQGHQAETAAAEGIKSFPWIDLGEDALQVDIGLKVDGLSQGMMLIVTFVGFLVHLFSLGYMKDDEGKSRYFGGLALFMFSMTGIVLANNFVMMFIFWELVGVSSYILISHWFTKPSAADAAKKAFLTNRIGDFGFMIGILLIWHLCGSFYFDQIKASAVGITNNFLLNLSVVLIFCGAIGKSAQVPLHVWLPDAMEGPTPVSALIHAATMVAAGVFMMARVSFLVVSAETAASVIAWIGAGTALLAALMALQQNDIKKILAYSTLSQLGYMIMAQGFGQAGSDAGMFHLYTHAFFKALLFLGSGAVIYACHHEQDIWKMGGLSRKMPITTITFAIGTLALIAFPFFSGFWSKEHILMEAWEAKHIAKHTWIYGIGIFVAFLTPFYMTRLFIVAFLGRGRTKSADHAHEVSLVMLIPLILLAVTSLVSVYFHVPEFLKSQGHSVDPIHDFHINPTSIASMAALAAGVILAGVFYLNKKSDPFNISILREKFYIDQMYAGIVKVLQDKVGGLLAILDRHLIEPLIARLPAMGAMTAGSLLRLFQVGNLQTYVFYVGVAVLLLIFLLIF